MEIGTILALLSAVCFAMSTIFSRRGVAITGEPFSALIIAMVANVIIFSLAVTLASDWSKVWSMSWQTFGLLGGAGLLQTALGRFLFLNSMRLLGANKAAALVKTNIIYAFILGIIVLNESLTVLVVFGTACIITGVTLVSIEKQGVNGDKPAGLSRIPAKGIYYGLGAGLCWGLSVVLIKPGIAEIGSPWAGLFVTYTFASLIAFSLLFRLEQRRMLTQLSRSALIPLVVAGVFTSSANLFRFPALNYSQISVVTPIVGTDVILILLFSFLLNRKLEVFTWKIIMGMVVAGAGVFLLSS